MTAHKKFKRLVRQRSQRTGESYASARRQLLLKPRGEAMTTTDQQLPGYTDVAMDVVRETPSADGSVHAFVSLRDAADRSLWIAIGRQEADAIGLALQGVERPRPLTHDMLKQAIDALEARFVRLVISFDPATSLFHADAVLALADGGERHIDCRPSDALALAARTAPAPRILVPDGLLSPVNRPSQSDFLCPECGVDRADSVVLGPAPTEPEWMARNFEHAVADGLVIHEPDAGRSTAEHLWQCANGHRFRSEAATPRLPTDA